MTQNGYPLTADERAVLVAALRHPDVPYGECWCGCGASTPLADRTSRNRGRVKGEPIRYLHGHNRRHDPNQYIVNPETGCWEWQRGKTHGYGSLHCPRRNTTLRAHRWYYEEAKGPIPAGMVLDHLCRNKGCVNPDHLEPVTSAENTRRSNGTKLTLEDARAIRASTERGVDLAERYGVSKSVISRIKVGLTFHEEIRFMERPEHPLAV
jgi:hypothetical protein